MLLLLLFTFNLLYAHSHPQSHSQSLSLKRNCFASSCQRHFEWLKKLIEKGWLQFKSKDLDGISTLNLIYNWKKREPFSISIKVPILTLSFSKFISFIVIFFMQFQLKTACNFFISLFIFTEIPQVFLS